MPLHCILLWTGFHKPLSIHTPKKAISPSYSFGGVFNYVLALDTVDAVEFYTRCRKNKHF